MLKTLKNVLVLVLLGVVLAIFGANAAEYAAVSQMKAKDVQIDQFPIEAKRLSVARTAELGLRPYALESDGFFLNHQKDGKFVLKLLKEGTIVLVDKDGTPRYEEKCGNRLIDPRKLAPAAVPLKPFAPIPGLEINTPPESSALDSARAWVNKLPEPAKLATKGLGWLAALGLLAAAGILVLWGLGALSGNARQHYNAHGWWNRRMPG